MWRGTLNMSFYAMSKFIYSTAVIRTYLFASTAICNIGDGIVCLPILRYWPHTCQPCSSPKRKYQPHVCTLSPAGLVTSHQVSERQLWFPQRRLTNAGSLIEQRRNEQMKTTTESTHQKGLSLWSASMTYLSSSAISNVRGRDNTLPSPSSSSSLSTYHPMQRAAFFMT